MQIFKQQARLFESALFAGGINANQNLFNGKYVCKSVHIEAGLCTHVRANPNKKTAPLGAAVFFVTEKNALLLHHSLGSDVVMVHDAVFVLHHLAVQFVDQVVHGGIQILVGTFGKKIIAFDMNIAFRSLAFFFLFLLFYREQNFDVHHLIEMSNDAV
jgi:hypothetical protein